MSNFLSPRLLAAAIIGLGLATSAWADPPAPSYADPVKDTIKPLPLVPIPDNPPPHEGALFAIPYVIEPPDVIVVEVLETLPGRPISGERLVRPDGTITLGFYGDVHVQGLTILQAKEKIIRHMRQFLVDETLGLIEIYDESMTIDPLPGDPGHSKEEAKPNDKPGKSSMAPGRETGSRVKSTSARAGAHRVRRASQAVVDEKGREPLKAPPSEVSQAVVPTLPATPETRLEVPSGSDIKITIEVLSKSNSVPPAPAAEAIESPEYQPIFRHVHPIHSNRVFVDVTAYNSKTYTVLGDTAKVGQLPCTGNETVLSALNYSGGFIPSADPKNIRLVRPARGGKPARVYKVDYEAIVERGEIDKNYQLFPGDRLIVGRKGVEAK